MSQELSNNQKRGDLKSLLATDKVKEQIARALPKHMTPDRFLRVATTAMLRTPKLAQCDQASFMKCMMDLSALGLEPDGRRAHLIPFENRKLQIVECQLIVDYKGLIELAKRSGEVAFWHALTICEKDKFSWKNGIVDHEIDWLSGRGKMLAVYSHVRTKDGDDDYEIMTLDEVNAIRARSRSGGSGPWVTDYEEMAKKTAMRRHSKRLTLSPEFHDAVEVDAKYDEADTVHASVVTETTPKLATRPKKETAQEKEDVEVGFKEPEVTEEPAQETLRRLMERDGIDFSEINWLLVKHNIRKEKAESMEALTTKDINTVIVDWEMTTGEILAARPKEG